MENKEYTKYLKRCTKVTENLIFFLFFFQAEDGIRNIGVTGVQTCALPIYTVKIIIYKNIYNFKNVCSLYLNSLRESPVWNNSGNGVSILAAKY